MNPLSVFAAVVFLAAMGAGPAMAAEPARTFTRLFAFGAACDEETAKKARDIGVTDTSLNPRSTGDVARARRYGFRAYASTGPCGVHGQVMTPDETALCKRLNGADLPKGMSREERAAAIARIQHDARIQWGGEPRSDAPYGDVLPEVTPCICGTAAQEAGKKAIDKLCAFDGIDGVAFDYVGFANFKGCYHTNCLALYRKYLAEHNLPDQESSKTDFYRQQLVDYYNVLIDHLKRQKPEWKVMAHIYPVFAPDPLYGNRLKVDYCGQTASWYFIWPEDKIRSYAKTIVGRQNQYFEGVKGVPFIGFSNDNTIFDHKSPAEVERELNAILDSGADCLMVHGIRDVVANPEVAAVFKKYCGR